MSRIRATEKTVTYSEERKNFVSTLFIGLGGTGKEVLMRFRKMMFEEFGEARLPFAPMIVIDTDMQKGSDVPKGEDPAGFEPVRLRPEDGEWLSIEITPDLYEKAKADLVNRLDKRYTEWLHPEFFKLVPEKAVKDGSGGFRQAGRLAFFVHYRRIRHAIETALEQMTAFMSDAARRTPFKGVTVDNRHLEVVIIGSLAGGTGAGTFLDISYLIRDILSATPRFRQLTNFLPNNLAHHLTFIGIMPTAYTRVDGAMKSRFMANGYAAMLELENYSTSRPEDNFFETEDGERPKIEYRQVEFRANWDDPIGKEKVFDGRPWHTTYLIDDVNDINAQAIRSISEVHQMVADYLFMDLGNNPFAIQKRSVRSNHAPLSNNTVFEEISDPNPLNPNSRRENQILFQNRYGCSYSSFGLAEIYIDPERIRRSAGYRLATKLIQDRWVADARIHGAGDYGAWAQEDLYGAGTQDYPLGFSGNELASALLQDGDLSWTDWIKKVFDRLDARSETVQDGEVLLRDLRVVLETINRLLDGDQTVSTGTKTSGVLSGLIDQLTSRTIKSTIEKRAKALRGVGDEEGGVLRRRLDRRSRLRFSQVGANPTMELLEEYKRRLGENRKEVAGWAKQKPQTVAEILARLVDAIKVPLPCRGIAVSIEYVGACKDARQEVMRWCRNRAAKALDAVYGDAQAFVQRTPGVNEDFVPLFERYKEWKEFLLLEELKRTSVSSKLNERFELFRVQPETTRRIPLVPPWRGADYDREIVSALRKNKDVGPHPEDGGKFDWKRAEDVIIRSNTLSGTDSCSLVEKYYNLYRRDPQRLASIAEDIATACSGTLGPKFGMASLQNGNVALYLISLVKDARTDLLTRLVESSAPYFPSIRASAEYTPVFRNLLGISGGVDGVEEADRLKEEIRGISMGFSSDRARDDISIDLPYNDSRLVLLRELAGVPLLHSSRLSQFRLEYLSKDLKDFRKTAHLRHRLNAEDLPDIQLISDAEYAVIANNVTNVVRGLVLRFISCSEDGMFFVCLHDEQTFTERTFELGTRLNRVIKHASLIPEVQQFLEERWRIWRTHVGKTPLHLAVLYNAIQQNLQQLPNVVSAGENEEDVIPPIRNCFAKLLSNVERELKAEKDGDRYFEALKRIDYGKDKDERNALHDALCLRIRKECLLRACTSVPVLQVDDKKVDGFQFFPASPSSITLAEN